MAARTGSWARRRLRNGLPSPLIDRILRVDHAGEFGADRIYAGQMAVLKGTEVGPVIQKMWDQEKHHLKTFDDLLPKHRVRPTSLLPVWNIAGFLLGAGSALLGRRAAMACTVAVEETITRHYDNQLRTLMAQEGSGVDHREMIDVISQFRDEEMEHHDTGLEHEAEQTPLYPYLKAAIGAGCQAAIWLSERL